MSMITIALVLILSIVPQATPNFAGTWEIVEISPPPATGGASLPPSDLTIRHSAGAVDVSRTAFGRVRTTVYSLDGREDKNVSGAVIRLTRSRWLGSALVTEGRASQVTSAGYAAWTLKEAFTINAKGHLIIDIDTLSETGETFRNVATYRRKVAR